MIRVIIVALIFIFVVIAKEVEENKCGSVHVNGKNHEEEVLINGINRPYQLFFYENNGSTVLYFSYNTGPSNESTFEIGYSKDGYPVPIPVDGVKNGFATAADTKHNFIYFGGSNGIFVQNMSTPGEAKLLDQKHDIWDLFYKDHLYFINFPERRLHKHISGNTSVILKHIHEKLYQFAIDGDGDTFITNKTGLFMIKKDHDHRIHLPGPKVFRAIAVNHNGVAHFCGRNEVYVVNKHSHTLHEIAKIKNIFGLTFDSDNNIIYSDPHQIVRLHACDRKTILMEVPIKLPKAVIPN